MSLMRNDIQNDYFNWLCRFIQSPGYLIGNVGRSRYTMLLQQLYHTDFYYTIPMDANRYEDGITLRYRFGREKGYDDPMIAHYLDQNSCSVLEMMVALAVRCEEHIIYDDDIEYQAGMLFWEMIDNLGLIDMTNSQYETNYVDDILETFLERRYKRDGRGGLFWIKNYTRDLRSMEIWDQMNGYLNDIYREEE